MRPRSNSSVRKKTSCELLARFPDVGLGTGQLFAVVDHVGNLQVFRV